MSKHPFLASPILLACPIASCTPSAHDSRETYILVVANTRIPYWQAARAGLDRAGREMKVHVDMVGPAAYKPDAERDELQNAVQEKPSGILVSAADAKILTPIIDSALQQGIPVITIDSDAPTSKRLYFIGTDNYAAGRLGGQLVMKLLGGKGNVVMFTYPNQNNLTERQHGYESVFQGHPDLKVTQAVDIQGDPAVAYSTAKQLISSKLKVDAFVCLEAIACPEVADVLGEANMTGKVQIVAMDTDRRTLAAIQNGVISATIAQKPYTMAYLGVKLLDDIHHHQPASLTENFRQDSYSPLPSFIDTGAFIVDKDNLGAVNEQTSPPAKTR